MLRAHGKLSYSLLACVLPSLVASAVMAQVDLSGQEVAPSPPDSTRHVLARPWYENLDLSGYGAAGYLATSPNGARPNGGFQLRVASLFVRAYAWENTSLYMEIQATANGRQTQTSIRSSEVYAQLDRLWVRRGESLVSLRAGRFAIPFGEEYGQIRVGKNPLVLYSTPYPWGFDEGVQLFGRLGGVRWITSLTDGSDDRGVDDNPSKSFNVQIGGRPLAALDVSASLMSCGRVSRSAMQVGGMNLMPVGRGGLSSLGTSSSTRVSPRLYQLDAQFDLGRFAEHGQITAFFGQAFSKDSDPQFDRTLTWFSVEPQRRITRSTYVIVRYSEVGTYDSKAGYCFDGGASDGGADVFGFDSNRFSRWSFGAGWSPNPSALVKAEVARDRFHVIDASRSRGAPGGRNAYGAELVLHF